MLPSRPRSVVAKRQSSAKTNSDNNSVHFEFIGILDLLKLGVECGADEVWYDIITLKRPKERAKSILPPEGKLNAIYWEGDNKPFSERPRI